MLRSVRTDDLLEVIEFCRLLAKEHKGKSCSNPLERFCIGFYQLHGAISWNNPAATDARDESHAAAIIHFITTMEMLGLDIESYVDRCLHRESHNGLDYRELLEHLSRSMQMLWYNHQTGKTQRASRYNPLTLSMSLGRCVKLLIQKIAPENRMKAIETATDIMTRRL